MWWLLLSFGEAIRVLLPEGVVLVLTRLAAGHSPLLATLPTMVTLTLPLALLLSPLLIFPLYCYSQCC